MPLTQEQIKARLGRVACLGNQGNAIVAEVEKILSEAAGWVSAPIATVPEYRARFFIQIPDGIAPELVAEVVKLQLEAQINGENWKYSPVSAVEMVDDEVVTSAFEAGKEAGRAEYAQEIIDNVPAEDAIPFEVADRLREDLRGIIAEVIDTRLAEERGPKIREFGNEVLALVRKLPLRSTAEIVAEAEDAHDIEVLQRADTGEPVSLDELKAKLAE
jgi:hypothetical protein